MQTAEKVTELARYRAIRQRPVTDLCRWSEAFEQVWIAQLRLAGALQRTWLRAWSC